ncbi:aminotransferase class V-fold PLP-dependent enzyme [Campylobacter sp. IFREMER_LSEM_CL1846]|uniref:aminotransferase class V-fold PLP-dependent enzyme n=1 Tax=Campylobacter sp. IFREMER_LSEM_CL1846 TaxID=2911614 RepID=UPI0021E6D481|nr:aminotransferase class V-fold PLP-dependent enzyme [Campylobacter sp. IFREMER_LSEM_CL1846]HEC1769169.1 aminotransferase class V-fold PLP-dependent enzyme [Campylobacter lari]MCV3434228.1 aminotransferase class V-fold PLP-dependent enzyme [Campylobacter sp. IFREMER_LSEM_CL1846]HEC1789855.1 aminotransferase class V-fold PLP-dependent enzyme [Campylobacter lari]HEC1795601.1 aminotransferase class V-fold PLP-dependent enzyme [Campylobacter lari]HEC1798693.1 aminotransferase class V-fold PLP-dep
MDIEKLKQDIILKKGIYYFDFTASALALKSIEKEIKKILTTYANTHSDSSLNSFITQQHYENARINLKKYLELDDSFALIACGNGSSAAIKKFQELLGLYIPPLIKEKYFKNTDKNTLPLVIVGPYEHHSNELSFREALCECVRVPLDKNGELDFNFLEKLLQKSKNRQIIASFNAASNVTGILSDYKKIYTLIKQHNGIVAFDISTLAPYANLDSKFYDAVFISSHKLLGGVGSCGLLVIKKNLCGNTPSFAAGGTVGYVSRTSQQYLCEVENLEEGGTPGIIQLIRASLAFKIRNEIGLKNIEKKEKELCEYFFKQCTNFPKMILYAKNITNRLPIFAFNIEGISPFDLAYKLSKTYKIETRAGCACAGPYGHDLLNLKDNQELKSKPGWLRVGFHYTHTKEDIEYFFKALNISIKALS